MADEITSSHGNPMISKSGYLFRLNNLGLEKRMWECARRKYDKCHARIHTTDSINNPVLLSELGTHNHRPDAIACEVKRTLTRIRTDAIASTDSPAHVIARSVQNTTSATQGALPLVRSLKRGIRRMRSTAQGSLLVPHRREDITLPEAFQNTTGGEKFLLFDSGANNNDTILIFTTKRNLEFLKLSPTWLFDGTFKVAPTLFDQLFVIHGLRNANGATFPLVYCLTPNRKTVTYSRILTELKTLEPGLNPITIMSDFEKASNNAFDECFPTAENKGCFFQQSQDILHLYQDFALNVWHLAALAFIPPLGVVATFEQLVEEPFFVENEILLLDILHYFEKTWLGAWNRGRTRRIQPTYQIEMWNCYQSVLEDLPKTNNACEGFHHGFATLLGATYPTIYKLIEGLKEQQVLTELDINQFHNGAASISKTKYRIAALELKKIVQDYASANFSNMDYLRRIAYRIRN